MDNKQQASRVFYLDSIKVLLTVLVIIHHTALAFTPSSNWIVRDHVHMLWLTNLLLVNMTFFMGAFFFIAGYFVPKSRENKSISQYVSAKAKRLLLPVLFIMLVIVPVYFYIAYRYNNPGSISFLNYYINIYWAKGEISYEHGWFLVSLFLYSMFYLLVEKLLNRCRWMLTIPKILIFIGIMSVLSYLIRLIYPIDRWIDLLGFIGVEPAHFPQYILMFLAGALAYKNKWLEKLSDKMGLSFSVIGFCMIILCYCRYLINDKVFLILFDYFELFESIMAVSILIGLIWIFKKYSKVSKGRKLLQENAFGAYVVHNLFVISLQVIMCRTAMNVSVKYMIASCLAVILSFGSAVLLRKLPIISKVL